MAHMGYRNHLIISMIMGLASGIPPSSPSVGGAGADGSG